MALNKKGIHLLADMLVANKKMYNQETFGDMGECGTVCCLAGFCLLAKIGKKEFARQVKQSEFTEEDCIAAGREQLGVRSRRPVLFEPISAWPNDLYREYHINGPRGRVVVALKALQRLQANGQIDDNPEAIHMQLPQLKALLPAKRRSGKAV